MSNSALQQAPFLPAAPPRQAVLDCSGLLGAKQLDQLNAQAQALPSLKAKIVVLPKTFSPNDIDAFGGSLARQWRVSGDRLLMVIDIKDHKVRVCQGSGLQARGLTNQVIGQEILPVHFVPYMKNGDLYGAIHNTLNATQSQLGQVQQNQSDQMPTPANVRFNASQPAPAGLPAYTPHPVESGVHLWFVTMALLLTVFGALLAINFALRKSQNKQLIEAFKERVGPLYEKADQIGSSSEYLQTKDHPELAQRIGQFFNKLTALEKAVTEVEAFDKGGRVWAVRNGYLKLLRMVPLLDSEADALKKDVFALTGGVQTVPDSPPKGEFEQLAESSGKRVAIPERFQQQMQYTRPAWTYQPAYNPPMGNDLTGLMMLGMFLSQMEMNTRFNQINWQSQQMGGGGWFGGGWNNNQSNSSDQNSGANFDSNWGDSQGGGDFGGAGADWGGGGDDGGGGGGGDFGGSGSDW